MSLGFSRQKHWRGLPFPSPMHACMLSCFSRVRLCATLRTAVRQAPLSMGFSRQEYWSGWPFPSPSIVTAATAAKSLQSRPALCDPIDSSQPGSSVPGILQAKIVELVATSFSNACMHAKLLQSCLTLCDPMDSSPPGSSVHGIL